MTILTFKHLLSVLILTIDKEDWIDLQVTKMHGILSILYAILNDTDISDKLKYNADLLQLYFILQKIIGKVDQ